MWCEAQISQMIGKASLAWTLDQITILFHELNFALVNKISQNLISGLNSAMSVSDMALMQDTKKQRYSKHLFEDGSLLPHHHQTLILAQEKSPYNFIWGIQKIFCSSIHGRRELWITMHQYLPKECSFLASWWGACALRWLEDKSYHQGWQELLPIFLNRDSHRVLPAPTQLQGTPPSPEEE